ncbi:UDP-N-acetylmuramoyl-tripeptide--D-alanyl-D-alanine ligase [Sphingobacterium hungaricum]
MQLEQLYAHFLNYPKISTDTRKIEEDSLFFALKGDHFNGNAFAEKALDLGARYVIIDEADYFIDERTILVSNVLQTLQELAKYHRSKLTIPIIGITGTNGKTTTKELLHAVLVERYRCFATKGNLNNHIGVPLSLLSIDKEVEVGIIEMGANHQGEIGFLCELAQPTHGLITNVGKAHLEGFGSFEGVKKAKGELYAYLAAHQGTCFIQHDNSNLVEMIAAYPLLKQIKYGFSDENEVFGKLLKANPFLAVEWFSKKELEPHTVQTKLTGSYNTENILAAVAVGLHFDVSDKQIRLGIEKYTPQNNRSQITQTAKNTLIEDYYNANASSMKAALENMAVIEAENKVIILGDMFELGDDSPAEHKTVIAQAKTIPATRLIFVGKDFYAHRDGDAEYYQTTDEALEALSKHPISSSFVLLKASRGMAFEKLITAL